MARSTAQVPVMADTARKATRPNGRIGPDPRTLGGPYGASFTGVGAKGLKWPRRWTRPDIHPYDEITWELRTASIANESGKVVFEQTDVEVPSFWSQLATNVVVSKYFRGHVGTPERERSVKQLIDRVVNTIAAWAETQHYFATDEDLAAFQAELTHLLVHQKMAFNSPVWFNVGIEEKPQCSACQPYRALVSTPDGMVPIGQLVEEGAVGREVYDAHGVTRIVAVKDNGQKPVWRVRLGNGNFIEATPDHVVKAVRREGGVPEWLRVDELETGMRMHLHPHRAKVADALLAAAPALVSAAVRSDDPIELDTEDQGSPVEPPVEIGAVPVAEAALAGWLQADGFVGQHARGTDRPLGIELLVATDDEYDWVSGNLDVAFPGVQRDVREADTKRTRVRMIRLSGEVLRGFVERWELLARGTSIRVPSRLWSASYDEICAYLRSVFQADGYVSVRRDSGRESARIGFTAIGERWTEDIQLLLNTIGIYSRRLHRVERRTDRRDTHEVSISIGSERARFAELIGFVGRDKQARLLESLTLRDLKACPNVREEEIVSIEELGVEQVYDIQTESGEYLSNNVAVHNCFINSVQDNMSSIMDLAKTEAMLFKFGSGAGSNLSPIRSSKERMSGGGIASGPVSFMKGYDAFAGVIKSGGKTRRAAKMVILDVGHPDVVEFIDSKASEERKAWALIEAGYDPSFTGEAYGSVFFQNANHSVRVTDDFMRAVVDDKDWTTHLVTTGEPMDTYRARDLFRWMAEAAWICGDPGIQYDTTVNDWHTSANTDRIYASNPCCFVGETLIDTADGFIRFDALESMDRAGATLPDVYSRDKSLGRTVLRPINRVWVAGDTRHLVEVRTERGRKLRCTPEHRWLTWSGEYVEAQDLQPGTRLRKVFREEVAGVPTVASNDRVLSVRHLELDAPVRVFDMEVEGTHNFGVSDVADPSVNSLVVSNSEYMFLDDTACFAPETRISTPDGLRTVRELYEAQERGEKVLVTTDLHSEHDHRRLTAHRQALVTLVGDRQVYRMTLKDGRQIRATGDHKFLTEGGQWKRVDELAPGSDRIEVRGSGNPVRFESSPDDVRRWQMLGWLTGDGIFSRDVAGLVFGPSEKETSELLTEEFNALIAEAREREQTVEDLERRIHRGALLTEEGVFTAVGPRERVKTHEQANGVLQVASKSGAVVRLLEDKYGMHQGTAVHKDVPTEVHRVADDLKIAYLQGLFSADGTIMSSLSATEPQVMLATSAPDLARSVQLILSDLGITSRTTWIHPTGRKNPQAQLHIYNQAARLFMSLIGFPLSGAKQAKVDATLSRPFEGARKNPRATTVVSIVPDGIETVYDITEPITHSVIAEGLIAHNCNLASLNLMRFVGEDGEFDVDGYLYAARLTITAQEILVDNASYPTPRIEENSHRFRPLGLGYANLGALLMSRGLAYDSDEGRHFAAALTALMHGEAYRQSAIIARDHGGPFIEYEKNRAPFLRVIRKHRDAAYQIPSLGVPEAMQTAVRDLWDDTFAQGEKHGYRNAQVTVLAPTGTIAFMMDCDTTGIEPDIALIKYKKLVGEGFLKIVNNTVPTALRKLGYMPEQADEIVRYVNERETIEGAPGLKPEHLPVFDCAFKPVNGERSIHYMGHVRMMAAVQPFLSGAISKTVNMPESATPEDIEQVYLEGWKTGLKAIAIYRDGSKRSQPLSTGKKKDGDTDVAESAAAIEELRAKLAAAQVEAGKPHRRRLPAERTALTHKFDIAGHEGYITVGLYPDGQPGEIFLKMAKEGSTVSGLMDTFATAISLSLQYGVPLRDLVNKFAHVRFEPSGFTGNQEIPIAKSIVDYIFRWLGSRFLTEDDKGNLGLIDRSAIVSDAPSPYGPGFGPQSSAAAGVLEPAAEEGPSAIDEAIAGTPVAEAPVTSPQISPEAAGGVADASGLSLASSGDERLAPAARPAAEPELPVVEANGHANGQTNGRANGGGGTAPSSAGSGAVTLDLGGTKVSFQAQADAPSCAECGSIMIRNGSCYKCLNCGSTSGCS